MQERAQVIDGRRARGERTRTRVLDALLALVQEGQLHPTALEVAERAGVALRTVYHHFEDVEALRYGALDLQLERYSTLLQTVETEGVLEERIASLARQLRKLYEAITPIQRATLLDQQMSEEIADELRSARLRRRERLEQVFAPELRRDPSAKTLLDAADALTSWQNWDYLRSALNRTAASSERILIYGLGELFSHDHATNHAGRGR